MEPEQKHSLFEHILGDHYTNKLQLSQNLHNNQQYNCSDMCSSQENRTSQSFLNYRDSISLRKSAAKVPRSVISATKQRVSNSSDDSKFTTLTNHTKSTSGSKTKGKISQNGTDELVAYGLSGSSSRSKLQENHNIYNTINKSTKMPQQEHYRHQQQQITRSTSGRRTISYKIEEEIVDENHHISVPILELRECYQDAENRHSGDRIKKYKILSSIEDVYDSNGNSSKGNRKDNRKSYKNEKNNISNKISINKTIKSTQNLQNSCKHRLSQLHHLFNKNRQNSHKSNDFILHAPQKVQESKKNNRNSFSNNKNEDFDGDLIIPYDADKPTNRDSVFLEVIDNVPVSQASITSDPPLLDISLPPRIDVIKLDCLED